MIRDKRKRFLRRDFEVINRLSRVKRYRLALFISRKRHLYIAVAVGNLLALSLREETDLAPCKDSV